MFEDSVFKPTTFEVVLVFIFLLAIFISILGSIPMGPVSVLVLHTLVNKNKREAILLALGGCLPEVIYCYLAMNVTAFLATHHSWEIAANVVTAIFMTLMGVSIIQNKQKNSTPQMHVLNFPSFFKGLLTAFMNPMLIAFWIFVVQYFSWISGIELNTFAAKTAFAIGAFSGGFAFQYFLIIVAEKFKAKILEKGLARVNFSLGVFLLFLGGVQLIKLFMLLTK